VTVVESSPLAAPDDTKWARLGDIADINPKWNPLAAKEDPVSFVGMAQMSDELGAITGEEQRLVQEVRTGYTAFEKDDLLVAKITPCFENGKIGRANITNNWGAGSTEFHVVRPGDRLDHGYALHFLRRQQFRTAGKLRMTGSGGQQRVPASYVADTMIPLPPLPEQGRIAAILDKADHLRTQRREALTQLDALTQSVFNDMFGGLLPEAVLSDAVSALIGGKNIVGADDSTNPYRVLKISAVTSGQYLESESKALPSDYIHAADHVVRPGDVIISRANTTELVGATALVATTNGQTVLPDKLWRAVPTDEVDPRYLVTALQSDRIRAEISSRSTGSGGSMKNISKPKLFSVPIAIPPLELQQTFARRVAGIEHLKVQHRTQLAELDNLFESLQHRAFRGKI
jgi:type I restriction enzyme S subunit